MKGLGAVSKGGGETTGTGALIEMFELGSSIDKLALQRTWSKLSRFKRGLFLDHKFDDPTTAGQAKTHIEATAEMIKKFLLGLQSIPRAEANEIFDTYMEEIKTLTGETLTTIDVDSSEELAAITGKTTAITGKVLRQTELANNLRMFEVEQVKDGSRKRFAVIEGILTPHMNRVKQIVAKYHPDNTWMKWTRVYDAATQRHLSGLIIPPSDVQDVQRSYGQSKDSMHTPETAMTDLEAGDKIKVIGRNNANWVLRMGRYGFRDGKIIIENAKMADREPLLNNGAAYNAQGSFFFVQPDSLDQFFRRFPIDNTPDTEAPQVREGRALYQPEQGEPPPPTTPPPTPPLNPIGDVRPGSIPAPEPSGAIAQETITEYVNPLLNRMHENYKANMGRRFRVGNLPEATKREIYTYLNQVDNDLSSTKLAAVRYGEQMRDFSVLNYSRRYGFDNYLNLAFPYIFWYSRSMLNWGMRAFDRPAWFAMYARLRRKQEEQERKGMPTRLRGKVRIPLPWLPEWMGGGIYIDPYKQIFPPAQFGAPMDYMAQQQNQLQRRTEQVLRDLVEQDSITQAEMDEALATQEGDAWTRAFTQAQAETEIDDSPAGLAAMLMQPALWWTIPSKLASGKGEEIGVLPITRFGQSTRTALRGTAAEGLGNLVGAVLAGPEEAIREKAGLSKYGQWGNYYIDRMIANLAADGTITAEDAQRAMIERKGPAYDLALQQTEQEMMLRTPGTLPVLALKEGAHPIEVAASVIASLFPGGLFPTGELKLRGLQSEYNAAWKRFDAGNEDAINQFFEKYPEYEARLALYDKPEDRLRQFLVSEIWDRYTQLNKTNRKRATQLLGGEFEQAFLNKETRSYDSTDIKQLATWAQMLGTQVPQVEETAGVEPMGEPLDLYTGAEIKAVDEYYNTRDSLFPLATAWQSVYYSLPAGSQRKAFLAQHPQLRKYWDWNTEYKANHPEIQPYLNEQAEQRLTEDINDLSAPLTRQLIGYYITGKELSAGAKSELNRIWVSNGSKGATLDDYMNMLIASMFTQ
jgi:hypothetical protein